MQEIQAAMLENAARLRDAITQCKDAGYRLASAEHDYRIAVTKRIYQMHDAEGVAWTAATDMARGDEEVARLRMVRDLAKVDMEMYSELIIYLRLELRIGNEQAAAERRGL